jgi:NAD(P)-dependent dehydrogenase (short-subunit alcohol dehydrogenase family)
MELKNRTAIVTGSGTGIGRAIAVEFAKNNARVVCCARRIEKIQETVDIIKKQGGSALAVKTDVTNPSEVKNLVSETIKRFGGIDVLFNNAGSFRTIGGLWEVDPEQWWEDVKVNLRGVMLCSHTVLPYMMKKDSGIIINMNGGGATTYLTGGSAYASSKAAVMRLTENLAKELEHEKSNVLVFGMGPGLVRTEMTELQAKTEQGQKWIPSTLESFKKGKTRNPEDCAKTTVELIRNACPELNGRNFSTGQNFSDIMKRLPEIKKNDLYVMRFKF